MIILFTKNDGVVHVSYIKSELCYHFSVLILTNEQLNSAVLNMYKKKGTARQTARSSNATTCLVLWQSVWLSDPLSVHLSAYSFVMWMAGGRLIFNRSRPLGFSAVSRTTVFCCADKKQNKKQSPAERWKYNLHILTNTSVLPVWLLASSV